MSEKNYSKRLQSLLDEILEENLPPEDLNKKLIKLSNLEGTSIMASNQRLLDVIVMKKNHSINKTMGRLTKWIAGFTLLNLILVSVYLQLY